MVIVDATVKNFAGIHVRPSGVIIKSVADYSGVINVHGKDMNIDLKNIMGLIAMGLQQGDTVTISVEGPDEETIASEIKALFEKEFDFPPRQ